MTRNLLAISFLLPLAFVVGCGPTDGGNDTGDGGSVTDGGNDGGDGGSETFSSSIVATIPFADVEVTVDGASVTCDGSTLRCTYLVDEPGEYQVEAWDTFTFVTKTIIVHVDNNGEQVEVSWDEGGCASDPDWDATTACDEWVDGEYGLIPLEGSYTDEYWGAEFNNVEVTVNETGIEIDGLIASERVTMSGNLFYGSYDGDTWQAGEVLDERTIYIVASTGSEWLLHRD